MPNKLPRRQFLELAAAGSSAAAFAHATASAEAPAAQGAAPAPTKPLYGPPYKLQGNRIVFTNWSFVLQGLSIWQDPTGQHVGVKGNIGPKEGFLKPVRYNPSGITLALYPARSEGPLLHLDQPWDRHGAIGTILHEDGLYRAWVATGWGDLHLADPAARPSNALCYMESRDGYEWYAPQCGTVDIDGHRNHNVVMKTHCFIGGGLSVFRDPIAPPEERYKIVAEANDWDPSHIADFERRFPHRVDPRAKRNDAKIILGMKGAVSPDGLQWTLLEDPLVVCHCDTQLVGTYNPTRGEYIIYTRDYVDLPYGGDPAHYRSSDMVLYARRAIAATCSRDFRQFPLPQLVLQADLAMRPSEVLYTNCYTSIPGAPDHHLMFPAVWDLCHHDETHLSVASSFDGLLWQFIPGEPVLFTGAFGRWDGGCIFAHPNLFELPNGDWALPYTGYDVPHKYPRVQAKRNTGYAVWPKGRMVSVKAAYEGQFETVRLLPPGKQLFINALTRRAGHIRVEVVTSNNQVIPGREMENCVPLFGDLQWQRVTWKEHDDLGIEPGEALALRFHLNQAEIFGLEFR